jgi:nucleoporin GLE1
MGGITSLYFAILQTPLASLVPTLPTRPTPAQLPTLLNIPLRFPASWTWLANSMREPMAGMQPIAHLVTAWIEILGKEAVERFGQKQLEKVLNQLLNRC